MIIINRKTTFTKIVALLLISSVYPWLCLSAQAQTATAFTTTDRFDIPAYNGTIRFAVNGTYTQASLESGVWSFVNLHLNNSRASGTLENFKASAQDSNVTITSCQKLNSTTGAGAQLRYTVVGKGAQSYNFGLNLTGGGWTVTFNRVAMAENDGWHITPNGTLIVTGATANVSMSYSISPESLGGSGDLSNQSVYQQHSVDIAIAVTVAIAVVLAAVIRKRTRANETKPD